METTGTLVLARRPMDYAGLEVDRGMVFEMVPARNNGKLLEYGYMNRLDPQDPNDKLTLSSLVECAECGKRFMDANAREAHVIKRHPARPYTDEELDRMADEEDRLIETVAPLPIGTPVIPTR